MKYQLTDYPGRWLAWLRAALRNPVQRHRLLLRFGLVALIAVALLSLLAEFYRVLPLDVWFTRELQEHHWQLLARVMYAVSIVGYRPWALLTVLGGALLVTYWRGWRDALYLVLITAGQGLCNAAIKLAIGRPRPLADAVDVFVPERGFSFPSGHVMFYTVFFGFLLFLALVYGGRQLRWLVGLPCAILIVLVGPARIILGSHWLSDVLAAYLLALVLLALAIEGYLHWRTRWNTAR